MRHAIYYDSSSNEYIYIHTALRNHTGNIASRTDKPSVIAPATISMTHSQPDIRPSDISVAIPPVPINSSAIEIKRITESTEAAVKAKTAMDNPNAIAPTPMLIALHPFDICVVLINVTMPSIPLSSRDIERHATMRISQTGERQDHACKHKHDCADNYLHNTQGISCLHNAGKL
ncbi:MAG: hypothetical protein M3247_07945 [Thermoproteota archaeon]|nr:hypothetical protein [Thermoproteota archaeon]